MYIYAVHILSSGEGYPRNIITESMAELKFPDLLGLNTTTKL